jgi:hypothetical protein
MSSAAPGPWLDTPALCVELGISRSTLGRWRRRGLLSAGRHWVRKNPRAPRSDLLWHLEHCRSLLRRLRDPYAASASNRRTTAALVCSPLISLR